jgi:hypothetical protein
VRCRKETPTNDMHYENITRKTKTGKTVNQSLMKGACSVCGTKKTRFVKGSDKTDNDDFDSNRTTSLVGAGASYLVEKRDISKRTYSALKELIQSGKTGYLTFGSNKYYVSPANVAQFMKAHEKRLLKKAAQVMSGERSHQDITEKIKARGGGLDSLNALNDILAVVGMLS